MESSIKTLMSGIPFCSTHKTILNFTPCHFGGVEKLPTANCASNNMNRRPCRGLLNFIRDCVLITPQLNASHRSVTVLCY